MDELASLVQRFGIAPYYVPRTKRMTQERIDWLAIGKYLDRIPKDCINKWKSILASQMKKTPFESEEDALIMKRVDEWGERGEGIWASLERELGL